MTTDQPASEQQPNGQPPETFASTFFGRLKEQSFTILVMVCIVTYQHLMWEKDREEYKAVVQAHQAKYEQLVTEERQRLLAREQYLMQQRDQFIDHLKEQVAWTRAAGRSR